MTQLSLFSTEHWANINFGLRIIYSLICQIYRYFTSFYKSYNPITSDGSGSAFNNKIRCSPYYICLPFGWVSGVDYYAVLYIRHGIQLCFQGRGEGEGYHLHPLRFSFVPSFLLATSILLNSTHVLSYCLHVEVFTDKMITNPSDTQDLFFRGMQCSAVIQSSHIKVINDSKREFFSRQASSKK